MKQISSFSTGLSSALMTVRLINKFGNENVDIIFVDTKMEDDDNYRFMEDFESKFGVKIIKISRGITPYDLMREKNIIFNSRIAKCPYELKTRVFLDFLKKNYDPASTTINIGFDYKEVHRCESVKSFYESRGYKVDFPLLWDPIEKRDYRDVFKNDFGIDPPRFYDYGYSHANCSGMCVKQGAKDWILTLLYFPERYRMAEEFEKEMIKKLGKKQTIVGISQRDKVTKKVYNEYLTLEELREAWKSKKYPRLLKAIEDSQVCINCSVVPFEEGGEK